MVSVSAQVSLYPLRQMRLSPAIERALEVFRGHGLQVQPGTMSTMVVGDDEAVFSALNEAFRQATHEGEVVMVATISNACPLSATKESSP